MVDNGSTDGSVALVREKYPSVEIIEHSHNKGYAGGVNPGFKLAIERHDDYVAPFNNDAIADKDWLAHLASKLDERSDLGIVACKLLDAGGNYLDSSGECYSSWGLPYPRGRGESDVNTYDMQTDIFAASGGASLYRVTMLEQIGLLDEDFFAYYEDVDLSFRAQLLGWKTSFAPQARVYHATGTTGDRIKGFYTYQTMKNLPWLLWKNLPGRLLWRVLPRFTLAHMLFFGRAVQRGHGWYALKACAITFWLLPKKLMERRQIQQARRANNISTGYIWSIMVHDLPPNANALRHLRNMWWKITGK